MQDRLNPHLPSKRKFAGISRLLGHNFTADLFLDFVNVTVLGAHLLGTINSLGLLNWITRK